MTQYDTLSGSEVYQHILGTETKLNSLTVSPGNCPYDSKDWQDIPTYNQPGHSVFVLAGEHETFRDDILEWSKYALNYPLDELDFKILMVNLILKFINILEMMRTRLILMLLLFLGVLMIIYF